MSNDFYATEATAAKLVIEMRIGIPPGRIGNLDQAIEGCIHFQNEKYGAANGERADSLPSASASAAQEMGSESALSRQFNFPSWQYKFPPPVGDRHRHGRG